MLFISYFFKTRFELIYFYNSGVFKYNLINVSEGGGRGGAHWALENTEVILKFQHGNVNCVLELVFLI